MGHRLTKDEFFMSLLDQFAARSTCPRRQVACIVTDVKGHILGTGYNGVPSGLPHCIDIPCPGAKDPSGDSSRCMAIHAEQNALLQCHRLDLAHNLYVQCTPCLTCAKLISNTSIRRIIFFDWYTDTTGSTLLEGLGRTLHRVSREEIRPQGPDAPGKPADARG